MSAAEARRSHPEDTTLIPQPTKQVGRRSTTVSTSQRPTQRRTRSNLFSPKPASRKTTHSWPCRRRATPKRSQRGSVTSSSTKRPPDLAVDHLTLQHTPQPRSTGRRRHNTHETSHRNKLSEDQRRRQAGRSTFDVVVRSTGVPTQCRTNSKVLWHAKEGAKAGAAQ